jgi:hypothetical protein
VKTDDIRLELQSVGLSLQRNEYIARVTTRRGWKGRLKPHMVTGFRWTAWRTKTGETVATRPTPAQLWKFLKSRPELMTGGKP